MNIYDIAARAGVSIATVSRVINGKPNVSAKTKKLVQDVMEKEGYTPNDIARGLVSQSMNMIGIVIEDVRNTHYSHTAYTVEQELSRQGYHSILCNTGCAQREWYFRMLATKQVDGLVLVGSVFMDDEIKNLIRQFHPDIPVVMVNGTMDLPNVYSIVCDDRHGAELCVDLLVKKGHKKIVYLNSLDTYSARLKEEGYRIGMFKHKLEVREEWIMTLDNEFGCAEEFAAEVAKRKGVTGIICGEDIIALGIISGLTRLGKRVPGDYAVTGYNNSFFSKLSQLKLTSVDNKLGVMGTQAAHMLCSVLRKSDVPSEMQIRPDLFIGNST
ncbi:MAG: LacI family transcriptional regulator [Planctomycetes bacterium]|nr:LacI family transcriptional regulator [Planctomycetota bacterium]